MAALLTLVGRVLLLAPALLSSIPGAVGHVLAWAMFATQLREVEPVRAALPILSLAVRAGSATVRQPDQVHPSCAKGQAF